MARFIRLRELKDAEPHRSTDELAARLGVSRRTVFRDLAFLRELGAFDRFNPSDRRADVTPTPESLTREEWLACRALLRRQRELPPGGQNRLLMSAMRKVLRDRLALDLGK